MPSTRRVILGHVMSGVCTKMNRTKKLPSDIMQTPLNRCLNTFDITLLGIGNMVGAGVYVLTGIVAKDIAGPGIVLSFIIAAMVSMLAALCYAEFGCRVPKAGSAYIYTYVSIGEFWAFVIGWNIILEHMLGAASVARAWSGYVDSMLNGFIANTTMSVTGEMHEQLLSKYPDFLAFFVCLGYALALATGVKTTAILNGILTTINVGVVIVVISIGLWHANPRNWATGGGFLPFGFVGVITGAASCFYAFVGFDSIATSGEEILPSTSIPLATILSLCIVTIIYVLVSAALTLMVPYTDINPVASLPSAFGTLDIPWAKYAISIGALCGMSTTLLGSLFALFRCLYAMASDGLLFSCFEKVNARTKVPLLNLVVSGFCSALLALVFDLEKLVEFMSIGTLLAYTIVSASVIVLRYSPPSIEETITYAPDETPDEDDDSSQSSIASVSTTSEMVEIALAGKLRPQYRWLAPVVGRCEPGTAVSISVLLFTLVSIAVCLQFEVYWMHMYKGDWLSLVTYGVLIFFMVACLVVITAHHQNCRGLQFKVPLVPFIPALSILCNIELMVHLSALTWLRLLVWLIIGMLVYFFYGIHHSREGNCCKSCMTRIPYATLIATVMCLLGVGIFCGTMYRGASLTIIMLDQVFHLRMFWIEAVQLIFVIIGASMAALGFMILFVGCLATGSTRYKVYRAWRSRVGGRISCAVFMGITYVLNIVWILILCFLVVVTFIYTMFWNLCSEVSIETNRNCIDLTQFHFMFPNGTRDEDMKICEKFEVKAFCKDGVEKAEVMFILATVSCLLVILSMVHYLMCLAANYAHIRDHEKFQELQEIQNLNDMEYVASSKDRF